MRSIIIYTFLIFEMVLIQCETGNNHEPEVIPPEDWITGVWRSEYNDSVKFISTKEVYMNSILHYCNLKDYSIELWLPWCPRTINSFDYEFNIKKNQFIIYNFYNIYGPIYFFHNPDSTVFTKSNEELQLPFEEWIQGLWVNQSNIHKSFVFSRPYKIKNEDEFHWCRNFVRNGIYYIGDSCNINQYVFTKDSLRIHWSSSSNLNDYSSFHFEIDKEDSLFILYDFNNLDTTKYYKIHNL